jgi:hypothetical protein
MDGYRDEVSLNPRLRGFKSSQTLIAPEATAYEEAPEIPSPTRTSTSSDVEKQDERDANTGIEVGKGREPHIFTWNGPSDPQNPLNWSLRQKWSNLGIVSALTFITPLASAMFAPGIPVLLTEFGSKDDKLAGFVLSISALGFAVGPMILAPMSELYGRLYVYHVCNVGFFTFTVACAVASNLSMLTLFGFFQGCFGAAPISNGT